MAAVDLPPWVDADFLERASVGVVAGAAILGVMVLVWARSVVVRVLGVVVLAGLVFAGVRYRDHVRDCARECDCSLLGEQVDVPGCGGRLPGI